jgi:probable HAF family extracellular repeat protein
MEKEAYMKFNVIITALLASALAACTSSAGGGSPFAPGNATAGSGVSGSTSASTYTVTDLGTLGGPVSGANSINNENWASGFSTLTSSSYLHAALWENGSAARDLGTLGGPNSGVEWPVKNDHGLISGIAETAQAQRLGEIWSCAAAFFPQPPSGHICRGFAWQDGKMRKLPTLGGNNGFAAGANDEGLIVGWAETRKHDSTCTPPQVLGFQAVVYQTHDDSRWRGKRIQALPPMHGDKDGAATEINDRGQIVGISGTCDQAVGRFTAKHAVMWDDDRVINLGSLGGIAWNTPMAINSNGEVVGFSDLPGDVSGNPNFHAFLWTKKTGMQDLGTLPGDTLSEALGINDAGQIVGESFNASSARAFIYENGKMTDLNTLIPPSSGLYLVFANDINDQGVIAGGACVLVSNACSSAAPAYTATPTGSAGRLQRPAMRPRIPESLLRLLRRRAML